MSEDLDLPILAWFFVKVLTHIGKKNEYFHLDES